MENINTLVEQEKSGKQLAFTKLYDRYRKSVWFTIMNIVRNTDVTDDLLSVVFTKAFMKIDRYTDPISFDMWLKTIAVNTSIDYLRKYKSESLNYYLDDDDNCFDLPDESTPENQTIAKQEVEIMHELMSRMRYKDREILRLKLLENKSYLEIASSLQISEASVKSLLNKAKKKLQNKFSDYNKQKQTNGTDLRNSSTSVLDYFQN